MPLVSKSINKGGLVNRIYEVGGVGRFLPIPIFLLFGERGRKIVVWYLVQHFSDWVIKLILHPVYCTQLKNQSLCAYKMELRQVEDFSYYLLIY